MKIGQHNFDRKHTYVMGILNVTPDSFSDGGLHQSAELAYEHAMRMIEEGAAIVDIGGESTRPGYTPVSVEEEIERVCPVIERIKAATDIPLSVDTDKSKVASAAIAAGADLINDIWGLQFDPDMAGVIAESGLPCCLMHNRTNSSYTDFLSDYLSDNRRIVQNALNAGIAPSAIILDPGIGFAKDTTQNLLALKHLPELAALGYPILVGASRKSVIGNVLQLPVNDRLEGTLAITAHAFAQHAMFVRVHDVKENVRLLRMLEAIESAK